MKKILSGNGLKALAVKLLIFTVTIALTDVIVGTQLKKAYFKQRSGYDYLTTYSIDHTTAQVLVFGSSRAMNIFNPAVIEKNMDASCFNVGRQGQSIFYHYAVLKAILKRYRPERVILSFDAGCFAKDAEDYEHIATLSPYYKDHPEIKEVINLKSPFEKWKHISFIYPYNSLLLPILTDKLKKHNNRYDNVKGFMALRKKVGDGPKHIMDFTKMTVLDSNKINTYRAFIQACHSNGVKLDIICPPYFVNAIGVDNSTITAKRIAAESSVNFLDYSSDQFFVSRKELFADFRHLNEQGAELFTDHVTNVITKVN